VGKSKPGSVVVIAAVVIAAVVIAVAVALEGSAPRRSGLALPSTPLAGPKVASRPASIDPLATGTKVALGVSPGAPTAGEIASFTRLVDARPRIVMWFQQWSEPLFYPQQLRAVAEEGATPMITWDPISDGVGIPLAAIAQGRYDYYLRSAAIAAASWPGRIYVRLGHEMNLAGSPFGPGHDGDTPAEFVSAWRHVVTIFRAEGAHNVEWVWSPNVYCDGACPFTNFYPGDPWVDWVALDGYNYSVVDKDPWIAFPQLFGPSYAILARLTHRPMMIGETASAEAGGNKAKWISGIGTALKEQFKRVRALIWFQRIKETDWRVNSSSSSLKAFRALVGSPLLTEVR
jgi:hypothetical protein